jgi:hypothetical protein
MRLLWDHAYPVAQAIGLAAEAGEWPQLGQPTTFFFSNPPLQAYLSLVPWLVFGSFWLVIWAMTSLNVLAVPLLCRGAALGVAVLAGVGLLYGLALSRDWPAQSVGFEHLLRGERDGAALRPDALRLAVSYVSGASFSVSQIRNVQLPHDLGAAERAVNGVLGLALAAGLLRADAKVLRRDADAWVSAALFLPPGDEPRPYFSTVVDVK